MKTIQLLPLEILCYVFSFLVKDAKESWLNHLNHVPQKDDGDQLHTWRKRVLSQKKVDDTSPPCPAHRLPYSWIRITHVCRWWRFVALSSPLLWSHIAVFDKDATIEMLKRSGDVPLVVSLNLPRRSNNKVEARAMFKSRTAVFQWVLDTQIHRIRTLVMPVLAGLLSSTLATNATQLRNLAFVESNPYFVEDLDNRRYGDTLPFPALESFTGIAALYAPVTRLCSSTLRTLVLRHTGAAFLSAAESEDQYLSLYLHSIGEVTYALTRMPLLEHLDVELNDRIEDSVVVAELPRLRSLRLLAATRTCAEFLQHLRIPQDTTIDLECGYDAVIDIDYVLHSNLLDTLGRHIADPSNIHPSELDPITSLSVQCDGYSSVFCGWRSQQLLLATEDDVTPDVRLSIVAASSSGDVLRLLRALPCHNVEILRVGDIAWSKDETYLDCVLALSTTPRLRDLTLESTAAAFAWEVACRTTARHISLVRMPFYPERIPDIGVGLEQFWQSKCDL